MSTQMTIVGNLTDDPRIRVTDSGTVTSFRVAHTDRRRSPETEQWEDGKKLFVNVSCWRALAENAGDSLRKGQPVIVVGRYYSREYEQDGQLKMTYELEATSIGYDMARGRSTFAKAPRPASMAVDLDEGGLPVPAPDREFARV